MDRYGGDLTAWLDMLDMSSSLWTKGTLRIWKDADETNYVLFNLNNSIVDGTGYRKLPVTYLSHSGSLFADEQNIRFGYTPSGDAGTSGTSGVAGGTGTSGSSGTSGATTVIGGYLHTETPASSAWSVAHNLNSKYVVVEVIDGADDYMIEPLDILYVDANNLTITFSAAVEGYARIIAGSGTSGTSGAGGGEMIIDWTLDDGAYSGITTTGTAGEMLMFGYLCYLGADGKFYAANSSSSTTMPVAAIAAESMFGDTTGTFLLYGHIRTSLWSGIGWDIGDKIYAWWGANGYPSNEVPDPTFYIPQFIGIATGTDSIFFDSYESSPITSGTSGSSGTSGEGTSGTSGSSGTSGASGESGGYAIGFILMQSDEDCEDVDGKEGFCVPTEMDTMVLVNARATVYAKGVTGTMDIQVRRSRAGSDVDMLLTPITVGDEYTAADSVIDTDNDDIASGDLIFIDIDTIHTTPAKGLSVTLSFEFP